MSSSTPKGPRQTPSPRPKPAAPAAHARPQPQAPPAVQPKADPARREAVELVKGAGAAAEGVLQANLIGGTQALHARLVAMQAAAHREAARKAAASAGRTAQPLVAAGRTASQPPAVQCKRSEGVDAFRVTMQPKTGGQPLPSEVRAKMEAAFGADFSDVRVHVGHEASRIGAIAYTWGSNIHFAPGHYNPHTLQGQKVLGHELWHVVQQKSGRVQNPFGSGVAVVQDHSLEAEADRMGLKAALTTVVSKPGNK